MCRQVGRVSKAHEIGREKGVEGDWVYMFLFTEAGRVEMEGLSWGKTFSV